MELEGKKPYLLVFHLSLRRYRNMNPLYRHPNTFPAVVTTPPTTGHPSQNSNVAEAPLLPYPLTDSTTEMLPPPNRARHAAESQRRRLGLVFTGSGARKTEISEADALWLNRGSESPDLTGAVFEPDPYDYTPYPENTNAAYARAEGYVQANRGGEFDPTLDDNGVLHDRQVTADERAQRALNLTDDDMAKVPGDRNRLQRGAKSSGTEWETAIAALLLKHGIDISLGEAPTYGISQHASAPDYFIKIGSGINKESKRADLYTPNVVNTNKILSRIKEKIHKQQLAFLVLNLMETHISYEDIKTKVQQESHSIPSGREPFHMDEPQIIVVDGPEIIGCITAKTGQEIWILPETGILPERGHNV